MLVIYVYRRSDLCFEGQRLHASTAASSLISTNMPELIDLPSAQMSPPLTAT